eukprot:3506982-Rhodomonas_salina.1
MSGTDLAYAATRLSHALDGTPPPCYAMSSTGLVYAGMRCPIRPGSTGAYARPRGPPPGLRSSLA